MSYAGTNDVIDVIGGTKNYSVGTNGICDMSTAYVERMIERGDSLIDAKLMSIYGTQGFGTSSYGTRGVPVLIKGISQDLAGWLCVDNLTRLTSNQEQALGTRLYSRAMGLLDDIVRGNLVLVGYSKEENNLPRASDLSFSCEENVVLSGTDLINLKWEKVIPNSGTVLIKDLDGTTQYASDVDFKMYYFNDIKNSGTNYGKIRRLSGTNITDGQEVRVIYQVYKDPVFGIRDKRAWGGADSDLGQSSHGF